jgi:hypothetical protein
MNGNQVLDFCQTVVDASKQIYQASCYTPPAGECDGYSYSCEEAWSDIMQNVGFYPNDGDCTATPFNTNYNYDCGTGDICGQYLTIGTNASFDPQIENAIGYFDSQCSPPDPAMINRLILGGSITGGLLLLCWIGSTLYCICNSKKEQEMKQELCIKTPDVAAPKASKPSFLGGVFASVTAIAGSIAEKTRKPDVRDLESGTELSSYQPLKAGLL